MGFPSQGNDAGRRARGTGPSSLIGTDIERDARAASAGAVSADAGPLSPSADLSPDRVKTLIAAFRKSQLDQQISSGRKDAFGQSNPGETSRRPGGLKRLTGE